MGIVAPIEEGMTMSTVTLGILVLLVEVNIAQMLAQDNQMVLLNSVPIVQAEIYH